MPNKEPATIKKFLLISTQENFFLYVNHFLQARPTNSGPIILLLDGHGSHWSVPALQNLTENGIFPFFFARHTSIWAIWRHV
jgi:hypothetical protein